MSVKKIEECLLASSCKECGSKMRIIEKKGKCNLKVIMQCKGKEQHLFTWYSSEKTAKNKFKKTSSLAYLLQLVGAILGGKLVLFIDLFYYYYYYFY